MGDVISLPRRVEKTEPLWRDVLGSTLRQARQNNGDRLVDIAGRAGISPQYLSEIERGRKEPSSEMIAAITGALGMTLTSTLTEVAQRLVSAPPHGPLLMAA